MKTLKEFVRTVLINAPLISDFYRAYWLFPRTPNSFRGVFTTFSDAREGIPSSGRLGYDFPELHSYSFDGSEDSCGLPRKLPAEIEANMVGVPGLEQPIKFGKHPLFIFRQDDYPLLLWLKDALKDSLRVFDLGGGLGASYYTYGAYITYQPDLEWTSCDVHEAVIGGKELAEKLNLPALTFTSEFAKSDGTDILITCGTLQYIEPSLADMLKTLKERPRYLIVHRVPFHDSEQYITVQNLLHSYVPYKIQNRSEFIKGIKELGYELVDSWHNQRTCSIPFHPECFVSGYYGFYFRLR